MNRKETTAFLSGLVRKRLGSRAYWASEVSLDYGSVYVKRVDFMQFEPEGVIHISNIEKGIFISYEVKSCMADYNSGFGKNFETEKNYLVMPMDLFKKLVTEIGNIGVMCPIPTFSNVHDEFDNPTPLDADVQWDLKVIKQAHMTYRKRSMAELLTGMKLRELRESRGLTRQELAGLIGVAGRTVGRYETGERKPDAEKLRQIAEALQVSIEELEEETEMGALGQQKYLEYDEVVGDCAVENNAVERGAGENILCPFRTYVRRERDGFEKTRFSDCLYERCAMYKKGECRMNP